MVQGRWRQREPARCEMNMTPLIDVTFQLIIFFMLVSNIVAEENPQMILPVLQDPQVEVIGEGERVFVNIEPQPFGADRLRGDANHLAWPGQPVRIRVGMRHYSVDDLSQVIDALDQARRRNPQVEILLRADSALQYESIRPVLDALAATGIDHVKLVAYRYEQALGQPKPATR